MNAFFGKLNHKGKEQNVVMTVEFTGESISLRMTRQFTGNAFYK